MSSGTEIESDWLRDVIRYSLSDVSWISSIDGGEPGPPQQRDPRFRKLITGIIFSQRFILSYHLIIIGFIALISSLHWSARVIRWRQRKAARLQRLGELEAYDGDAVVTNVGQATPPTLINYASSSGSSTLEGTASPSLKVDENTSLLNKCSKRSHRSVLSRTKALLMYQPRPIPLFNKTLPSNGTTIVVLSFIGLNIFYCFYHINFNIFELFVLADRIGLVFAANLPLLYILAAKTQPLKVLTGYSYESLNILHRRLGEVMCIAALLHTLGMMGVWYTLLRPSGVDLVRFILNKVILLGLFAFISYEVLYFTSLASFRQRWYELFLGIHVVLQAAALVLLFFHHRRSRIYVVTALAIFLIDRLVYRLGFKSTTVVAKTEVLEDQETVRLTATISIQPTFSRLFGKTLQTGWQATDHVFVTIPSLSRKYIIQAHPFTIASPAPDHTQEETSLELLIRAQDGFSADLLREAHKRSSLNMRLDGPYGSSHARHILEQSNLAILVAGGSGIAVIWPLLHHLLAESRSSDTEIATTTQLPKQGIVFVWVVHKNSHKSWINERDLNAVRMCGVHVVLPEATEVAGRPNLELLIDQSVQKCTGRIGVVASGPDSMGRAVRNACAGLVRDGKDIGVTIEKFGCNVEAIMKTRRCCHLFPFISSNLLSSNIHPAPDVELDEMECKGSLLSSSSTSSTGPPIFILPLKIKYARGTYDIPDLDADFSNEGKDQFIEALNAIDPASEPGRVLNGRVPGYKIEITVCWEEITSAGVSPGDVILYVLDSIQRVVSFYILLPDGEVEQISSP